MLLILDVQDAVVGFQVFPETTKERHISLDVTNEQARALVGLPKAEIEADLQAAIAKGQALRNEKEAVAEQRKLKRQRQQARDAALDSLTYDFGDGRVMQARPKDEANILRAIETMRAQSIERIQWVMQDNTKHAVTADELERALASARLAGLEIWNNYEPI